MAIAARRSPTHSAMSGPSPPTPRTCRRTKCSGAWRRCAGREDDMTVSEHAVPGSPAVVAAEVKAESGGGYPEPFRTRMGEADWRRLGNVFGLTQFGVNLETFQPGAQSALRHWHTLDDEFVYVLEGEMVLLHRCGRDAPATGHVRRLQGGGKECASFRQSLGPAGTTAGDRDARSRRQLLLPGRRSAVGRIGNRTLRRAQGRPALRLNGAVDSSRPEETMYTLYGKQGSGSATTQIALEVSRAPYRVVETASWAPNAAFADLLRVNPLGQIPTLVLPDGSVLVRKRSDPYLSRRGLSRQRAAAGRSGGPRPGCTRPGVHCRQLLRRD